VADTNAPETPAAPSPEPAAAAPAAAAPRKRAEHVHEVNFVTYPKLLFVWPLILAGFLFWPLAGWFSPESPNGSETLGWTYAVILLLVMLTLGVDVDRNQAVFWVVLLLAIWIGGKWLADVKGFTLFGNIYNWFAALDVQYNRNFGLAVSIVLLVPFLLMILWARFNDRWRITHNEFEHFMFGKMDDSLGRGAKTIRTSYPDVFELLLGLAGTLVVYNATGTRELRRIPHVMFLPFIRQRLNQILERTAVTAEQTEEEEEDVLTP